MLRLSFGTGCVDKQQSLAITSALPQQPLYGVLRLSDDGLCLACVATKTKPFENNYGNYRDTIQLKARLQGRSFADRVRPGRFQLSVHTHQILLCLFIG